ncbi:Wzz/FepE/Etk N-terminal domain-containing protein [Aliidiomarina sanyensis]|uniref:LPS O-antigen length regulator n=1 Tax=Aliidiomarina sanyensis TaxID=1249555 RepID=A0A432WGM4_9GAMM|nr:Wzz/FepE/Etk N-terminal domain-containing protein [Aliidiomarina sanyensis]RUO32895.1 LPS O-antigen length regulator [Aliidiomarina sanyensis]
MTQHQNPDQPTRQLADDEIDLRELFRILWNGKWIIIVVTFVFAVGSVLYALSLPNIYQAEAKLAPTKESQGNGIGSLGQLGGLASLAGVNLPRGQVDNARMAQEIMRSRAFLADFAERRQIAPDLIAVEKWDPRTGEISYDPEIYNAQTQTWMREVRHPKQTIPTAWELVEELREILRISQDTATGIVSLSIEHQSPIVAKNWVDWLIEDINNEMRRRDIEEAERSIQYIENEFEKARLANTQQVYASLLEQQTQTIMLANVRPEYVFRVLDPAVIPEQRAKPSRALIAIIGTFLGGFLGLVIVLAINIFRS